MTPTPTQPPAIQTGRASTPPSANELPLRAAPVMIDIGPAVHQGAGLSRYAHALAQHLLPIAPPNMPVALFYNRHSGHTLPVELRHAPTVTVPMGQYAWRLGALAGSILRLPIPPIAATARRTLGRQPLLYHATEHLLPYVNIPSVMTVHDLIFESLPQYHTRLNRAFLRLAMPRFLNAATAIIAVSAHTAHDIVARYHIDTAKIHVIHEGVDAQFQPADDSTRVRLRDKYAGGFPFLLMVGTLEPRKNHALALHALARLRAAGHPHRLVIAGGHGWLFDSVMTLVDRLDLREFVHFAGYVPAQDLPGLYSAADCFLLPSLYEGFGFPVLEAMACGTPVVCSNVSSLPEIAGDAALLVSPHDDAGLATAIQRILTEADLAKTLRRLGLARAARFRWPDCAEKTLQIYQSVGNASQLA